MFSVGSDNLCKLFGISVPILQGGMAWASDAVLASAVSRAGGLGVVGCGGRDAKWIIEQAKLAKNITSCPVAFNFPLEGTDFELVEKSMSETLELGINIFTLSGSQLYTKILDGFSERATIIPLVGTVMQAKLAERAGAKAIICEGQESGGTIGKLSLFSLLPQITDAVSIPVIAAGGIADGRGINAALSLGASGVQLGTRFLASDESPISDLYKDRILKAKDISTSVIFGSIGRSARVINNRYSTKYLAAEQGQEGQDALLCLSRGSLRRAAEGDAVNGALMAGECSGLIREVMPAAQIVTSLIANSFFSQKVASSDKSVRKFLNHMPPILLVDEVTHLVPGMLCEAKSKFDQYRWFFDCHYPGNPIMPGSLLMELMSQVMTVALNSDINIENKVVNTVISQVEKIKFNKPVFPEMELTIVAEITSLKRSVARGLVTCKSNEELICSCEMVLVVNKP